MRWRPASIEVWVRPPCLPAGVGPAAAAAALTAAAAAIALTAAAAAIALTAAAAAHEKLIPDRHESLALAGALTDLSASAQDWWRSFVMLVATTFQLHHLQVHSWDPNPCPLMNC